MSRTRWTLTAAATLLAGAARPRCTPSSPDGGSADPVQRSGQVDSVTNQIPTAGTSPSLW
jgi:hypothetical protein